MNLVSITELLSSGTSEGARKGWDERGRGRTSVDSLTKWFGHSKVVDKDGNPLIVYHGQTPRTETDAPIINSKYTVGRFFSSSPDVAKGYGSPDREVSKVYLKISKPFVVDAKESMYDDIAIPKEMRSWVTGWKRADTDMIAEFAYKHGYDGAIIKNVVEPKVPRVADNYIVFDVAQIRKADDVQASGTSEGAVKGWETRRTGGAYPAQAFVSPSVREGMTLEEAHKALRSADHIKFKQDTEALLRKVASNGTVISSVGFWKDGAENSLVVASKDAEASRYVAAKMALAHNQKGIVDFAVDPSGPDARYRIFVPKNYTDSQIYASLAKHGIENGTIVRQGDTAEVRLLDFGSQLLDGVKAVAREYGSHIYRKAGKATWTGGDTREEGAQALGAVVRDYETKHGIRAAGDRRPGRDILGLYRRSPPTEQEVLAYGTSEGVKKEWDTRGRGRNTPAKKELWVPVERHSETPTNVGYFFAAPGDSGREFGENISHAEVNRYALYQGESSRDFLEQTSHWNDPVPADLQQRVSDNAKAVKRQWPNDRAVQSLPDNPKTIAEASEYEGFGDANLYYEVIQRAASDLLSGVGYKGAEWKNEDDLIPHQYQIWDRSAIRNEGQGPVPTREDESDSTDVRNRVREEGGYDKIQTARVTNAMLAEELACQRKLHARIKFQGLNVSVENRKGSIRRGVDDGGHAWKSVMPAHYGYIRKTTGLDGEHLDCFIGPNPNAPVAYIIMTKRPPDFKTDDEQKCMLGFNSANQAKKAFFQAYDDKRFFAGMKTMPMYRFLKLVRSSNGDQIHIQDVDSEVGEPAVYDGGYSHIEMTHLRTHPPSLRNPKHVPNPSDPRETDDSLMDVTKRKDRAAARLRNRLTRQHTDQNMKALNTSLISGFPSGTIGGFG